MSTVDAVYYPTSFFVGLAAVVTAVVTGAFIYGGGSCALAALVGAAAVAADFFLLVIFSVTWLGAASKAGRRLVLRGALALAVKIAVPAAVVSAALWWGVVDVYAVAFSALAVCVAAPVLLVVHFLRRTFNRRPVP